MTPRTHTYVHTRADNHNPDRTGTTRARAARGAAGRFPPLLGKIFGKQIVQIIHAETGWKFKGRRNRVYFPRFWEARLWKIFRAAADPPHQARSWESFESARGLSSRSSRPRCYALPAKRGARGRRTGNTPARRSCDDAGARVLALQPATDGKRRCVAARASSKVGKEGKLV